MLFCFSLLFEKEKHTRILTRINRRKPAYFSTRIVICNETLDDFTLEFLFSVTAIGFAEFGIRYWYPRTLNLIKFSLRLRQLQNQIDNKKKVAETKKGKISYSLFHL